MWLYIFNMIEYDVAVSFYIYGNMFKVYFIGWIMKLILEIDIIIMGIVEWYILEFKYFYFGEYMFYFY